MSLNLVPKALIYLERVAQLGSIQAAAKDLNISASAIHRQIATLEETSGEQLFERTPKGMVVTSQGQLMLDMALSWRLEAARLWTHIQENRGVEHGRIKLAAMDAMANGVVPSLLKEVADRLPFVQVEIDILSPDNAAKGVLRGEYDLAMVSNAPPERDLIFHWKEGFPLGCIAAPMHPVATAETLFLEEFVSHPVVFQSNYIAIRQHLEVRHGWIFEKAKRAVTVNSPHLIKELVAAGEYIALTSALDVNPEISAGRLRFIPIRDENAFEQSISVISNKNTHQTELITTVIGIAVAKLTEITKSIRGI